jgi:hypothetical protein
MARALTALVVCAGLISMGCGPEWPSRATTVGDRGFLAHPKTIDTVDVLPLDLELWTASGFDANPDQLRSTAETWIANIALATLTDRHYTPTGVIDWNGDLGADVSALSRPDLLATIGALAGYGSLAGARPGALPVPYLPARLGDTTHSDATLFVGGWAFVGNHEKSTGAKVAEGIAIALVVVAVVAIIVIAASALDKHGHGGPHGGGEGHGVSGAAVAAGRGVKHIGALVASHAADELVDAFGHTVELVAHTAWADDPELPHEGDSQMYLEMTLIDNHTGLTLWHVHQVFPASAVVPEDVERVANTMLASLPAR